METIFKKAFHNWLLYFVYPGWYAFTYIRNRRVNAGWHFLLILIELGCILHFLIYSLFWATFSILFLLNLSVLYVHIVLILYFSNIKQSALYVHIVLILYFSNINQSALYVHIVLILYFSNIKHHHFTFHASILMNSKKTIRRKIESYISI